VTDILVTIGYYFDCKELAVFVTLFRNW